MNQTTQSHSAAWITFTYVSFGASALMVGIGVYLCLLRFIKKHAESQPAPAIEAQSI